MGVYYATRPTYSTTVVVTGTTYYYAGGVYYVQTDAPAEPPPSQETTNVTANTDSSESEHAGVESVEMTDDDENYQVVASPVGATVPYLPDEAEEENLGGKTYFVYADTWYKPFVSDGDTIYMVVEDPREA